MFVQLLLIQQKVIDLAGVHRELAERQVERDVARGSKERAIVRDNQTGFTKVAQEVLKQNLCSQIQKVGRFVKQQEVRFMQQQRSQLHTRLPSARQLADRSIQVLSLQFELAGNFTAFPVRLATVAHQKLKRRFTGQKWIVLSQVTDVQFRMANNRSAVEFLFTENASQQRRFAGTVSANKPTLVSL